MKHSVSFIVVAEIGNDQDLIKFDSRICNRIQIQIFKTKKRKK